MQTGHFPRLGSTYFFALLIAGLSAQAAEPTTEVWDPVNGRKKAVEALGFCEEGKLEACRQGLLRALELQPGHLEFLQSLASAEERLGHPEAALAALAQIHQLGYELTFDPPDEPVARVVARPEYQQVLKRTAALRAPLVRSQEAFRLPYRDFIAESVVHDKKTGDFFIGSVHQRRIVRRRAHGELSEFAGPGQASGENPLWSVLGMAVDSTRRHLWVTTNALPNMIGYRPELEGRSALLCYDLDKGTLLGRYEAETPGKKGFNDVRVAAEGSVWVTDHEERPGSLYRLDPKTKKLERFGDPEALGSPEGLTFSEDGRYLFIADYSYGVVRFEVATGKHLYLPDPPGSTLIGLDHLEYRNGALIAVQNGNQPNTVLRLPLSADQSRILGVEVLERKHPAHQEATLGTLVGDDLYYIANSQWNRFDDEGKLPPAAELDEPIILRLPL